MTTRPRPRARAVALLFFTGVSGVATSCGRVLGLDALRFDGPRAPPAAGGAPPAAGGAPHTDGGEGGEGATLPGGTSGAHGGRAGSGSVTAGGRTGESGSGGSGGESGEEQTGGFSGSIAGRVGDSGGRGGAGMAGGAGGAGASGAAGGGTGPGAGSAGTAGQGQGGAGGSSGGVAGAPTRALNAIPIPTGYQKYCSILEEDGTTNDFAWGEEPCEDIVARGSWQSPRIERAGFFDPVGRSTIVMHCPVGDWRGLWTFMPGVRALELAAERRNVGLTDAGCVFTVAPQKLPIFTAPFSIDPLPPGFRMSNRGFDFAAVPGSGSDAEPPQATLDLGEYSQPPPPDGACNVSQPGCSSVVNYRGEDRSAAGATGPANQDDNNQTFEWRMSPGAPVLAMATGEVIAKRARPVSGCHTAEQNELYVRHVVGPSVSSPYSEAFVVYYAHLDFKAGIDVGSVIDGGETLGYVGTSGCTDGEGTLAVAVLRTTNTAREYRAELDTTPGVYGANGRLPDDSVARIDPWGWWAPQTKWNVDPGAYVWHARSIPYMGPGGSERVGGGAFSIALFFPGVAPPRPCDRDIRLWAVQGGAAIQNPYANCSP